VREYSRSGKLTVRYVASWPERNGDRGKATFSVGLYGENEALRLAVVSRRAGLRELGIYAKSTDLRVLCPQRIRARVFGSVSHRDLRFGENQVWRFALSTCSFEVEKEKWGLFIDSEGGSGVIGGETLASCKSGVFAANEERPMPVRNRF